MSRAPVRRTANAAEFRTEVMCPQPTCGKAVHLTTKGFIPRHTWEPGVACPLSGRLWVLVRP